MKYLDVTIRIPIHEQSLPEWADEGKLDGALKETMVLYRQGVQSVGVMSIVETKFPIFNINKAFILQTEVGRTTND